MPHFRTWDDIYYDYHGACDLILHTANPARLGELQTDASLRAANYQHNAQDFRLNP